MDVVIGIDTGTTSTKGIAAGPGGEIRALTSVHYPLSVPGPGRAELDPAALTGAAVKALTDVAAECRAKGDRVIAIGLSSFLHALVPMDAAGRPLGPVVTWADNRSAAQCERIVAGGRAHLLQSRTGTPVHPMSPLTKLAWWADDDPGTLRATARWGGVKELIVAALTGGPFLVDLSIASGTGLYDIHSRRWDDEAMQIAGVRPGQLAEVVPTTHALRLSKDVAAATGLPAETPLIIGAADGPLANLGVGATAPGVGAVSLGTSGALRTVVGTPTSDDAGRLFCYALTGDRWVIGGAVNNAGSVVRWAGQTFFPDGRGGPGGSGFTDGPGGSGGSDGPGGSGSSDGRRGSGGLGGSSGSGGSGGSGGRTGSGGSGEDADDRDAQLLAEAAGIAAGSEGLLCLPYLLGERAPWWRPGLRGGYLGLRREHGRPHLVRAAVEGVCQQLALVRDSFDASGNPLTEIRATGGAAASKLWISVLASALDLPVTVADVPEGTALGACLLARHALGELPDLDRAAALVPTGEPTRPDPHDADLYRRLRPLVERSALAVLDIVAELDRLAPEPLPSTEKAVRTSR